MATSIKDLSQDELSSLLEELGEPKYRAKQLYEWLHVHNALTYDEMTNLPKSLREKLSQKYPLFAPKIIDKQVSKDGTRKYVLELEDGNKVETVGIVSFENDNDDQGASSRDRLTVCVSSQVGCGLGCKFCATGQEGFTRDLTSQEIVDQIIFVLKDFSSDTEISRISNVVIMGQGEPFANYDNVLNALNIVNSPDSLNIGARKITVSTSGIIDGVYRFAEEPEQFRLAVSLHSAVQNKRDKLMPKLSNQPLNKLKEALLDYALKKHRRVTLEYMLIDGVNDSDDDFDALLSFCENLPVHVNLIELNKVDGSNFRPSKHNVAINWMNRLQENGVPASIRNSRGSDINGACGQLKNSLK